MIEDGSPEPKEAPSEEETRPDTEKLLTEETETVPVDPKGLPDLSAAIREQSDRMDERLTGLARALRVRCAVRT